MEASSILRFDIGKVFSGLVGSSKKIFAKPMNWPEQSGSLYFVDYSELKGFRGSQGFSDNERCWNNASGKALKSGDWMQEKSNPRVASKSAMASMILAFFLGTSSKDDLTKSFLWIYRVTMNARRFSGFILKKRHRVPHQFDLETLYQYS